MYQNSSAKNVIVKESESLDGPPLDFSFKNIRELTEIKKIEPRGDGKRKPIPADVSEEPKDDPKKSKDQETENQAHEEKNGDNQDNENENDKGKGEEKEGEEGKEKEKKEEQAPAVKKGPEIIRIIPTNNINNIIMSHNIPINSTTGKTPGGKNIEETKTFSQKKVVKVHLICTSLLLSYNKISSLDNFFPIIDSVMYNCEKLTFINLSHNHLVNLNYTFSEFKFLKSLYLHSNYIKEMKQLMYLEGLPLRSLTIHGNPIDTIPNFRLYIIATLKNLKKLDTVLITKKERDNAKFFTGLPKNSSLPEAKNPAKPPDVNLPQANDQNKGN